MRAFSQEDLNRPAILLVDDDHAVLNSMRLILEAEGYNVLSCPDASSALDISRSARNIALLLTDFQMPGLSGLDLAREVADGRPRLPVMIVSGIWPTGEMQEEFRLNGWRFLGKPIPVPDLLKNVQEMITPQICMQVAITQRT